MHRLPAMHSCNTSICLNFTVVNGRCLIKIPATDKIFALDLACYMKPKSRPHRCQGHNFQGQGQSLGQKIWHNIRDFKLYSATELLCVSYSTVIYKDYIIHWCCQFYRNSDSNEPLHDRVSPLVTYQTQQTNSNILVARKYNT